VNGCRSCFGASSPVDITLASPTSGDCDFCGSLHTDIWPTTIWADDFARVIDIYRVATGADVEAASVAGRLQSDWSIFSFDDPDRIQAFVSSVFGGTNDVVESLALVVPRFDSAGRTADHAVAWEAFVDEITAQNRYFPSSQLELEPLEEVIKSYLVRMAIGTDLFRARPSPDPVPIPGSQMGSPPPSHARPGRANSLGIPALYAALDQETAIRESRVTQHGFVTVAMFKVLEDFEVLDLAEVRPENPFKIDDDLVATLASSRYLARLGLELSRPTRTSDNQLEYIPTQYLCDFVKSLGIKGVRYQSSMSSAGSNLVLFDQDVVQVQSDTQCFEVYDVELRYRPAA
jgi:RES domain-containing protein